MLERIKHHLRPFLPRNIIAARREKKESKFAHVRVISVDPAVILLSWGGGREALHDEMKGRPLTLLYFFARSILAEEIPILAKEVLKVLKRHPKHRVVMMCNEEFTVDLFRKAGIEAIFCNHNAWVNEGCFAVNPGVERKYDAIYNATLAPYKRHQLAAKIESLALITYRYAHVDKHDKEIRQLLAHAHWVVDAQRDDQKATASQVAAFYHQSRTGLCLSGSEGAMLSSCEYLLCGLPVVTTRNTGGRDAFFEPEYVEWVDDTPEAVSEGVQRLIARAPGSEFIRARTLEKIEEHRQRMRELLKDQVPKFEAPWPPGSHGPFTARNFSDLGRELRKE